MLKNAYRSNTLVVAIMVGLCCLPLGVAKNNSTSTCESNKEIVTGMIFASHRTATGTARIVKSSADLQKVNTGDIIVTVMTQDAWLPVMKKSSGIITNIGDSSCHAALYGKKYNIPVVVGAGNATEKINDGNIITLDCSEGYVGRVYHKEHDTATYPVYSPIIYSADISHHAAKEVASGGADCGKHEVRVYEQKAVPITPELFDKHRPSYISYVLDLKRKLDVRNCWYLGGETAVINGARYWEKCDEFAIECMKISYGLFDCSEEYISSVCSEIDFVMATTILEKSNARPGDKNWLAKVSHEEHIKAISLPADLSKEKLMKNPAEYRKVVEQKRVNQKEFHSCIATSLFVRYRVDKVHS